MAHETATKRVVRVAVVGSGLAGLTAAYLLSTAPKRRCETTSGSEGVEFEVHIFEKAETLGMDSHSVSLAPPGLSSDLEWRVDVPMRSFQGGYYPQLIALYKHLGVSFRHTDFSYSFSYLPSLPPPSPHPSARPDIAPTMIYDGASGTKGISVPTALRTWSTHPVGPARLVAYLAFLLSFALATLVLLHNFLRLQILAAPWFRSKDVARLSWAAWVERATPRGPLARWFRLDARWREFTRDICTPLFSAVCTAAREDVQAHPAEEFLDFIWLTLFTHHYVVSHGVRDVVARLTASIPPAHIHLGAATTAILPDAHDPALLSVVCTPARGAPAAHAGFAHVVLAAQANHAAPLVRSYARALAPGAGVAAQRADALAACLARFEYRRTVVVNHTDARLLPARARDRRDLNFVTVTARPEKRARDECEKPAEEEEAAAAAAGVLVPSTYTMTTQMLLRPAHLPPAAPGAPAIYQTTNPVYAPDEARVLSVARMERAVLTRAGKEAVRMLSAPPARAASWVEDVRRWVRGGAASASAVEGEGEGGLGALQGAARREGGEAPGVWVVGSYAYRGIPLLEGCVAGAREVVERGIMECEGVRVADAPW